MDAVIQSTTGNSRVGSLQPGGQTPSRQLDRAGLSLLPSEHEYPTRIPHADPTLCHPLQIYLLIYLLFPPTPPVSLIPAHHLMLDAGACLSVLQTSGGSVSPHLSHEFSGSFCSGALLPSVGPGKLPKVAPLRLRPQHNDRSHSENPSCLFPMPTV